MDGGVVSGGWGGGCGWIGVVWGWVDGGLGGVGKGGSVDGKVVQMEGGQGWLEGW